MDHDDLLRSHYDAVTGITKSAHPSSDDNHFAKVAEYAERIRKLRGLREMSDPKPTGNQPPSIIYGVDASEPKAASARAVDSWEDEGGALHTNASGKPAAPVKVPSGVVAKTITEYRVGPYVYQDLDLAVAEHLRQLSAEPEEGSA